MWSCWNSQYKSVREREREEGLKKDWTCVVDREKLHRFGTISLSINSSLQPQRWRGVAAAYRWKCVLTDSIKQNYFCHFYMHETTFSNLHRGFNLCIGGRNSVHTIDLAFQEPANTSIRLNEIREWSGFLNAIPKRYFTSGMYSIILILPFSWKQM